jgi:hypothetical protein
MYGRHEAVNADALAEAIGEAVHAMLDSEPGTGRVERLPSAA